MTIADEVRSIREGVGFARESQVSLCRVDGPGAAALLDAVATRPPPRRDGLAIATLLLSDDASVWADLLICADAGGLLLLAEGPGGPELLAHLNHHAARQNLDVQLHDLADTHELIAIDGPFAWEPLAALVGPEVIGVPPQTSFRLDPHPGLGLRASKTGEHGYVLIVPRTGADELHAELATLRERFTHTPPSIAALDLCSLESGFFSIRTLGRPPSCRALTPIELQLQWRVRHGREFVGAAALRNHVATQRVTWWLADSDQPITENTPLTIGTQTVGHILHALHSPIRGRSFGLALIDLAWAHPGLPARADGLALHTVSPPLIDSRSLHVRPHQHRFAARDTINFPSLIPRR